MQPIAQFHGFFATAVVAYLLVAGIWGLLEARRGAGLSGSYAGILVIAQIMVTLQALAGIALLVTGRVPQDWLHLVYGAVAALVIPGTYAYFSKNPRVAGFIGIGCLIGMAVSLRAWITGGI